jgi:lysophospholipase L1-like esterase
VKRALQHLALAVLPLLLVLLLLEGLVRASGAARACPNRFSNSDIWVCDPILHFRVSPDLRPADQPLNRQGFRGADFGPRRPGVLRILALGDSCTFGYVAREDGVGFVLQPYPLKLQRYVERRLGEGRVEVLNAGVPGYNSFHGVLLLRSRLRGLDPDLVTVRYGWNDHFLSAHGESDGLYREPDTRLLLWLEDLALRFELYAFVRRLGLELRARREPVDDQVRTAFRDVHEWRPTIPIDRYAENLRRIALIARSRGAEVWLLTAPRNPAPGEEAVRIMSAHNRIDFERLMRIHDEYNDVVRRVGGELGVRVVDMDVAYRERSDTPAFIETDVAHPSQGGHVLEAEILYRTLLESGLLERGRS